MPRFPADGRTQLAGERLRSHGGLAEQQVPFLLSHPVTSRHRSALGADPLRNFDIFSVALNGVEA
jgi:phosphonoacetate hydrolase